MIKYIGSKRTLVPLIVDVVRALPDVRTACDIFTGTTRVAQALKAEGIHVRANDLASYAEVFARCYVATDARGVDLDGIVEALERLQALRGVRGYATRTFCERARYFQPHNGMRIDAIRAGIDEIATDDATRAILLTSLLEAADRVDSTTGLQMAYLKRWAPRSYNDLELRVPALLAGPGAASRGDANELTRTMAPVDVCYVDPPYNQHSYHANYHVWETIVRADEPDTYGVAHKRVDCREVKSPYNSRRRALAALSDLVEHVPARYLVLSFNDEGFVDPHELGRLLAERAEVASIPVDHRRYVGAQIGIHNPKGERVGRVSHLRNREHLFVVGDGAVDVVGAVVEQRARVESAAGGR